MKLSKIFLFSVGDTPSLSATKRSTSTSGKKDKINKRNERGETPLHLATIKGDITQMQELLKQGADINIADYAGLYLLLDWFQR